MKMKKKILFFIALLSLFYCVSLIQGTYAKYITTASANADITIARWNILVNNQDILQNSNFTSTIIPDFEGTTNIREGVIAPTAEGTFEVIINGDSTDVSFEYTLDVDLSSTNTVTDLVITKYVLNNVEHTVNSSSTSINNIILLNDYIKSNNITFYVKWNDAAATQTMNNAADTQAAHNGVAAFDLDLNVVQIQ